MKRACVLLLMLLAASPLGAQKTETTCRVSEDTITCETKDPDAELRKREEADRKFGEDVGGAIGRSIQNAVVGRKIKKYCQQHPGEEWQTQLWDGKKYQPISGVCPGSRLSADDLAAVRKAAEIFADRHPEFLPTEKNGKIMITYMQQRGWDLRQVESYESAYAALKNRLELKKGGDDEKETIASAADAFASRHPEFVESETNAKIMLSYMTARGLDLRSVESYEKAFAAVKDLLELKK